MKINHNIFTYLKNYSYNPKLVNRLIVSSYLVINEINVKKNSLLKKLIIVKKGKEKNKLDEFIQLFKVYQQKLSIEELIELFEFVVSPADKEINGAVYTPPYIREYIVNETIAKFDSGVKSLSTIKFGDIACGCGGFFITVIKEIKRNTKKSYYDIFKENIYGLDIQRYSTERTKILLSILAITNGEDCSEFKFNIYHGNALDFNWKAVTDINSNGGFDIIIGNPPYVGSTKIDKESKQLLKNWSVSASGKSDLYIPFFEIGMENLNNSGVLGYITVNTFYKSLNGRAVRDYFSKNSSNLSVIDFGGEQLFSNRSTYTCICIIGKIPSSDVKYIKTASQNINKISDKDFLKMPYEELNNIEGWHLIPSKKKTLISKIENIGTPLGEKFEIRNGFATLKNKVFMFTPSSENENYYTLMLEDHEFKIEKEVCRNAIKPNTLKSELDIPLNMKKLIFPYHVLSDKKDFFLKSKKRVKIMDEEYFKSYYPCAFEYLYSQKDILSRRDKGEREYEQWYAYGRSQALSHNKYKLLFPYISNTPYFILSEDTEMLFYNGYAALSDSIEDLRVLQKILTSKIFWFYIENTSKPYNGDYFSLAKNYVKNFGVCDLTKSEKKYLLNLKSKWAIDSFLEKKYNIQIG